MSQKFSCEKCGYFTDTKQHYVYHCNTKKHVNNETTEYKFECNNCNKKYKSNVGLWKHKKICKEIKNTVIKEDVLIPQQEEINEDKLTILITNIVTKIVTKLVSNTVTDTVTNTITNLLSQNNEEIKNIISELAKTGQLTPIVTNPTINDHSINSHNKIDINVFLNEKCQNAVNMSSLIKDIMFGAKDIENITKHGYVKAITDRLVDKIGGYSVYERPIHYYIENSKDEPEENEDPPQETIHIKENNKWNTEEIGDHDLLLDNLNTINDVMIEKSKKNELVNSMVKRGKRYDQTKEVIKNVLQTVELNEHQIQTL
jgi:hypothetical protein